MIIVLKPHSSENSIQSLIDLLISFGVKVQRNNGVDYTVLALIGDTAEINVAPIQQNEIVHKVIRVQEPFKRANRLFHLEDSVIRVGENTIGADTFTVIAGPCSVESEEQMMTVAKVAKEAGAHFLRGGAFKPRTSPYSFQGLGREGLDILKAVGRETGLGIVSEIMSMDDMELFQDSVDIIQVGARNMQNFSMLKELGHIDKPILLKRGLSATIEEWLMSAEYIMVNGNDRVILCERGIRTFETYTRNTLDIGAVPVVKKLSHLPVLVDPSHATGIWWMVEPLSKAAVVAGADGVMLEVHPDPEHAMSDGAQSLKPAKFAALMRELEILARTQGKKIIDKKETVTWLK
jgi:3-deoxy-7-phosphoheptulonate synthase